MKAMQNAGGHVGLSARAYPIAYNAAIKAGQVVKLSGGKVISAIAAETGAILGIAAENHPGVSDALNPRANGTEILVYDNPELIFECPAPTFEAAGGSSTTVTAAAADVACSTADAFNGGVLVSPEGIRREIADYAQADSVSTFTVASGETAEEDDVYTLFPPVGAVGVFNLDSTFTGVVLTGAGCTKIKVVGYDVERGMIKLMAVEHALGVEN